MSIWVVCADSTRARVFSAQSPLASLEELEDLVHPQSRARERELVSDRPGRTPDSPGGPARHTVGHEDDAGKEEADRFARQLAEKLNAGRRSGRFERIHLLAAPAFLGLLRKHLDDATEACVASELASNVVTEPVKDIRARLPERL